MTTTARKRNGPSRADLADALGVSKRTLHRYLDAGCPLPKDGESLPAWRHRALDWHRAAQVTAGRPQTANLDEALLRYRRVRALRAEAATVRLIGDLHDHAACTEHRAAVAQELATHWLQLPALIVDVVNPASETEAIAARVLDVVRRHSEMLFAEDDDSTDDAGDVAGLRPEGMPDVPAPPEPSTADVRVLGDYWLSRWRSAKARQEELHMRREQGLVHDAWECRAELCSRLATFAQFVYSLPERRTRQFRLAKAATVARIVADDVNRALRILHGEDLVQAELDEAPHGA